MQTLLYLAHRIFNRKISNIERPTIKIFAKIRIKKNKIRINKIEDKRHITENNNNNNESIRIKNKESRSKPSVVF